MVTTLLFDLGNVLLYFDHRRIASGLSSYSLLAEGAIRQPAVVELLDSYEEGRISSPDFHRKIIELLRLTPAELPFEAFVPIWSDIFTPNRELLDLLPGLAERYTLGLISNTNELHIARVREQFPEALVPFTATTFSHEAGCRKPDPEMYRRTVNALGARPAECLYVDDIGTYVAAAEALGIRGFQFRSTTELLADFAAHGVRL